MTSLHGFLCKTVATHDSFTIRKGGAKNERTTCREIAAKQQKPHEKKKELKKKNWKTKRPQNTGMTEPVAWAHVCGVVVLFARESADWVEQVSMTFGFAR